MIDGDRQKIINEAAALALREIADHCVTKGLTGREDIAERADRLDPPPETQAPKPPGKRFRASGSHCLIDSETGEDIPGFSTVARDWAIQRLNELHDRAEKSA